MTKKKPTSPLSLGNAVLIRAVTNYFTGRIVGLTQEEILIEDAAWISSTGQFSTALSTGHLDEVEPYPDGVVSINRGACVDVCSWGHALPREQK